MNSGRDTAHRVAKPRRIEAPTWHGVYFHASLLGFGHVVTKLLLHRHLFFGRTGAMIRFPDSKHSRIKKVSASRTQTPDDNHSSRR